MGIQVTIDGNNLDNGDWRRVLGFSDAVGSDFRRVVVVDFLLEADTVAALNQRYDALLDDFVKVNPRVVVTEDDTAGYAAVDMAPNDGRHGAVGVTLEMAPGHEQTGWSKYLRLKIESTVNAVNAGGGGTSGTVSAYDGQHGTYQKIVDYGPGRVPTRGWQGTFVSTFAYSGTTLTFTSVENNGSGKARFVLDAGGSAPEAFTEGMRIEVVTSSGGYLGRHVVTAVDVPGKKITTDTTFAATATGTLKQGEITTGLANFSAARSSILTTHLLTTTTGARGATGLALTVEKVENAQGDDQSVTVYLQSETLPVDLTGAVFGGSRADRKFSMTIKTERAERWNPHGGTRPVYVVAEGVAVLDMSIVGTDPLHSAFAAKLQPEIEAAVKSETGENTIRLLKRSVGSNRLDGSVIFSLRYQARNTMVLSYSVETQTQESPNHIEWIRGGYHYLQRPEAPRPKTATVTVTRVGRNKVTLSPPKPPSESEGSWEAIGPMATKDLQPEESDFGTLYSQVAVQTFIRYRLEGGAV